jgi:hypothetical protein
MVTASDNGRKAFWPLFAPGYSSGETILEANPELTVRVAIAVPLLVTSTVWLLLHVACRYDSTRAQTAASTVAWLLVVFALITGFSIGLFVMPAAITLVIAASLTPVARS